MIKKQKFTDYKYLNNITGWAVFTIATLTYFLTMQRTCSFWDCGEFIACSYKLEIGHPPGAPSFMLIARLFSLFAPGVEHVALMMNAMSALCSSFTVLFLFWCITHLTRRLVREGEEALSLHQILTVIGSGVIGSLAYTFSDTFWFSAVEAEVYAFSSLFTAIVFWAILKWEEEHGQPYAARWIVLIFFLVGISIGVHLLNLLALPAILLVIYFKKYPYRWQTLLLALAVSVAFLGILFYVVIPGLVELAFAFDYFFVNSLNMSPNIGGAFCFLALFSIVMYGLHYTHQRRQKIWNLTLLSVLMLLVGYSTFAIIIIRADAQPPLNVNDPDNPVDLLSYINRDQYGEMPSMIYGKVYQAQEVDYDREPTYLYSEKKRKYEDVGVKLTPIYPSEMKMAFSRMWSNGGSHVKVYRQWGGIDEKKGKGCYRVRAKGRDGKVKTFIKPTMWSNLKYFFSYQMGWMYFRYFMWNFAGRQNDFQGHGDLFRGNWISGIPLLDTPRLGPQAELPDEFQNKAHNRYYLLPLLLGIIGMIWSWTHKSRQRGHAVFWTVAGLFFVTGPAIVIYLNQSPYQPRERDYAYAASFFAFAIWIGMGFPWVVQQVKKVLPERRALLASFLGLFVAVPLLMAVENWDDHDRSDSYLPRDMAKIYLSACDSNSILFTSGDNETFPLWYAQEVEGYRCDVRVCNTNYLSSDWYIDRMKRRAYESSPLPVSTPLERIEGASLLQTYLYSQKRGATEAETALRHIQSTDPRSKLKGGHAYLPGKHLRLALDTQAALKTKIIFPEDMPYVQPAIEWSLPGNYMYRNRLMQLDMLVTSKWKRPIHFSQTSGSSAYLGLNSFFRPEGMLYKVVPFRPSRNAINPSNRAAAIRSYHIIKNFSFGNTSDEGVYVSNTGRRSLWSVRSILLQNAHALLLQGEKEKSQDVVSIAYRELPFSQVPFNSYDVGLIQIAQWAGAEELAEEITHSLHKILAQRLHFLSNLPEKRLLPLKSYAQEQLDMVEELISFFSSLKKEELIKEWHQTKKRYAHLVKK